MQIKVSKGFRSLFICELDTRENIVQIILLHQIDSNSLDLVSKCFIKRVFKLVRTAYFKIICVPDRPSWKVFTRIYMIEHGIGTNQKTLLVSKGFRSLFICELDTRENIVQIILLHQIDSNSLDLVSKCFIKRVFKLVRTAYFKIICVPDRPSWKVFTRIYMIEHGIGTNQKTLL